jgi:hypothetical protein
MKKKRQRTVRTLLLGQAGRLSEHSPTVVFLLIFKLIGSLFVRRLLEGSSWDALVPIASILGSSGTVVVLSLISSNKFKASLCQSLFSVSMASRNNTFRLDHELLAAGFNGC